MQLRVPPQRDVRRHPGAGGEDASLADAAVTADGRHRMDQYQWTPAGVRQEGVKAPPHLARTDPDDEPGALVDTARRP